MSAPTLFKISRFDWERIVLRTQLKPVALKALALVLATYADAESGGQIHPGVLRLTDNLGQDERTIRRNLEQLERVGLILKLTQGSRYGRRAGMASTYQLTVPSDLFAAYDAEPDDVHMHAQEIIDGHRPGFSTWIERNPLRKESRKPTREPRPVKVTGSPDISNGSPDILDRSPGIHAGLPDMDARPTTTNTTHEASNQEAPGVDPSLRSGSGAPPAAPRPMFFDGMPEALRASWETFTSPPLEKDATGMLTDIRGGDEWAEINRQTEALRSKYPQEEWR